jgi:hypothetical protein
VIAAAALSLLPHTSAPPIGLEADYAERPSAFRLVLPRAKRERLERQANHLPSQARCPIATCTAESLAVLVIESEEEARLCPYHELVRLDGTPLSGQPLLAVPNWNAPRPI